MSDIVRADGRSTDQLREVTIERGWSAHAEGSALVSFGGTVSAVDATTNKIAWQISNSNPAQTCYGGTTTTASNILMYGTLDGVFHVVNAANGTQLYQQKLQYGADAPPVTYSVNGKQYIAIVDGGSVFTGSAKGVAGHGDGVYVFALPS